MSFGYDVCVVIHCCSAEPQDYIYSVACEV